MHKLEGVETLIDQTPVLPALRYRGRQPAELPRSSGTELGRARDIPHRALVPAPAHLPRLAPPFRAPPAREVSHVSL